MDYAVEVGGWTWKSLALARAQTEQDRQFDARYDADRRLIAATTLRAGRDPLELIARSALALATGRSWKPEYAVEIAFNQLDSRLALVRDTGARAQPVLLPAANVRVQEIRGEAFANVTWVATARPTVDAGLAVETSDISVSGDAARSQAFTFLKPSASIAWRAGGGWRLSGGVRRTVGQLDFGDFAASADLADDTAAAGNPALGPDRTTRWYVAADWRAPGEVAAALELFHEARQDVLELVRLPSGAPGLANAGDTTVRGARGSFDDPLTGGSRPLSGSYSTAADMEFRHDPPGRPFAWGLTWRAVNEGEIYFVDQIDAVRTQDHFGGFVETVAARPVRLRLSVRNAEVRRTDRLRSWFTPDRSGALTRTEQRFSRNPTFVTLTVSGRF